MHKELIFFVCVVNRSSVSSETEPPGHNTAHLAFVTRERQDSAYVNFQHRIVLLGLLSCRLGGLGEGWLQKLNTREHVPCLGGEDLSL